MKIKIYVKTFIIIIITHINKTNTINYLHNDKISITYKKLQVYYTLSSFIKIQSLI